MMTRTNGDGRNPLVLVVDDDITLRELMRVALEASGFDVEDREDGTSAMAAFDELSPDLILLDVMMPGMDGYQVCRAVRQHPKGRHFPVVMVTGLDDTLSIDQAYDAGATDFITKPVNVDILGHRVRYILRSSQAEAEAAAAHALLKDAVESIPAHFRLFDADDRLIMMNSRASTMHDRYGGALQLGVKYEDILRASADTGFIVAAKGREEQWLQERLGQHADPSGAFEQHLSDGRWMQIYERKTTDGGTVAVGLDITALKQRESALIEARIKAEAADRAKTEFLANTSHELRTPLNAVIGFSQLLASEALGPLGHPQYLTYTQDILSSGRQLLEVINDILDMSNIESGKLELKEEVLEIAETIRSCHDIIKAQAAEANLTLDISVTDPAPVLFADPRLVKKSVLSLLSNAVKFTTAGGTVELRVDRNDGGALVITIRDNGIGIPAEDLDRILTPFGQADGSLARKYEGSGLGLSLTKSMIELHGGRLELSSVVDAGTKARLIFPSDRLRDDASQWSPEHVDQAAQGSG